MSADHIIWITWERQRRSVTLAASLGARLHVLLDRSEDIPARPLRYTYLLVKTVRVLLSERPEICCCQNPSLMLAVTLGLLRPLFRYRLIVDRHSNFKFNSKTGLKWRLFHVLSDLSLRLADLTIVTNDFLAGYVGDMGGRPFVLQDRLPALTEGGIGTLKGSHNAVLVCGFGLDEPIEEAFQAAKHLDPYWHLYVTGNYRAHLRRLPFLTEAPPNVTLTGFLDEREYQTLLRSADVVLVLTSQDHTLMCGAYEAVALGKPVVTSDTAAMRAYFRRGFLFTRNTPDAIRDALRTAIEKREELGAEIRLLRDELKADWEQRFEELRRRLGLRPSPSMSHAGRANVVQG